MDLTPVDIRELKMFVAPLIDSDGTEDYRALSFDVRMMRVQKAITQSSAVLANSDIKKVREIAHYLLNNKSAIPQVFEKRDILKEIVDEDTWSDIDIEKTEHLRLAVRNLVKYITGDDLGSVDIDVTDELLDPDYQPDNTIVDIRTYQERVIDYLVKNREDKTIEKIRNLEPLNKEDAERLKQLLWFDLGSENEYNENAHGKELVAFIRSLVGIDQDAVNKVFEKYLKSNSLNSKQQEFLNVIVKYVQKNGDIKLSDLLESDPFKSINWNDLFGGNVEPIKYTVSVLHDAIKI